MRICNKCGINKEYSFFFKSKKYKYYLDNKEFINERNSKWKKTIERN